MDNVYNMRGVFTHTQKKQVYILHYNNPHINKILDRFTQ